MKNRLTNAGILLVVGVVGAVIGWFVSVGFYALGLWPIGALIRLAVFGWALFTAYWVIRHLVESEETRIMKDLERIREQRELYERTRTDQ